MRFRARRYWRDFAAAAGGIAVGAVILAAAGWLGFARPPSVGAPSLLERAPAPPEARYGGTLVVVRPNEPQTLNPLLARDTCSLDFVSRLFNSLFTNDSDCRVVPDLVRSWTTSSDHRVWTFRLREGVRWHDGQEFTARDVVFTYRALLDPATASPRRADFTFTSGPVVVEALGRHEVRFVLPQPVPQLLSLLTVPILPEHQFAGRSPLSDPRNERPVGTGPFIFEAWEQGRYLSMRAFDDYFEGRPYIDRLEFIIEPDPARRAEMLSSGEALAGWVDAPFYSRVATCPSLRTYRFESFVVDVLAFNLSRPPLSERNVRRAIAHLVDRDMLVSGPLCGVPRVATSHYPPMSPFFHEPETQYYYDPEAATLLLQAAAWKRSGAGFVNGRGQLLTLTISVAEEKYERLTAARHLSNHLARAGIPTQVEAVPERELIDRLETGDFEAAIFGLLMPPDSSSLWHSRACPPAGSNFFRLASAELDRLLEAGRATGSPSERKRIYADVQSQLMEELPALPLYVHTVVFCVDRRVVTPIEPSAGGTMLYVARWYLRDPR